MFGNKSELKKDGVTQNVRYYHGNYEKLDTYTGGVVTATKHIYYFSGGNGLCAIATIEGSNPAVTYNYVYTDHLGSILKLTNNIGVVTAEQSFDAWGRLRNPNNWNDYSSTGTAQPIGSPLGVGGGNGWLTRGYTGHEHVPQVDLINMNGRMYDALLGRMLSPDCYVQDATSTQAYNRYSYVMNNPLKYTDPSGWIAYNKQREYAMEPDPNNYRSGTGGSVGNWGFYANGGASSYNYSGPYSLYASNPAQYASTYGSQTWMQQETASAYEAQKKERERAEQIKNGLTYNAKKGELGYWRENNGYESSIVRGNTYDGAVISNISVGLIWMPLEEESQKGSNLGNWFSGFDFGAGIYSEYGHNHTTYKTTKGVEKNIFKVNGEIRSARAAKFAKTSNLVRGLSLAGSAISTTYTGIEIMNTLDAGKEVSGWKYADFTIGFAGTASGAILMAGLVTNPVGLTILGAVGTGALLYGGARLGYQLIFEP